MYRGRGRGGGHNRRYAKEEPYDIFPEIKELPDVNLKRKEEEYRSLVSWGNDLQKFWISSPYHLEAVGQNAERNEAKRKAPLSDYMMMSDDYVPAELVSKNVRHSNKKIRWDPQSDLQRLDIFEKLDREPQDDGDKEKKEDEDEDDEIFEEEEDESENEYQQNADFDDDEDDFNMQDDGGGDEGDYE